MGFLKSNKGSHISEMFMILHDAGPIKKGFTVDVSCMDDRVVLRPPLASKNTLTIPYSQITDVFYGMESELQTRQKSPIARAVAGGLLFGQVGAVVGAVSGVGVKQKTVNTFYFAISYTDETGEDVILRFQDTRLFKGRKLAEKLRELVGLD